MDLSYASDFVPQKYANHLKDIGSKDIMYTIDYSTPDTIGEKFTELDAYYLGLTQSSADREKYGLAKSGFDR